MPEGKRVSIATNPTDVSRISRFIHDKEFELNKHFSYDSATKRFEICFAREGIEEAKLVRKVLFFKIVQFPIFKSQLIIHRVIRYDIRDGARIGRYSFNEIDCDEGKNEVVVYCHEDLDIRVSVESIQVEVLDVGVSGNRFLWLLPGTKL